MVTARTLVVTGFGLNCDKETAYAVEQAGSKVDLKHLNELFANPKMLREYQNLINGGGFSWGDDHGAGQIYAGRFIRKAGDELYKFIEDGGLVANICNGCQSATTMGIVPALGGDYKTPSVSFTANDCRNFRDQWVMLEVDPESPCVFTKGMDYIPLPVRHAEGKFYTDQDTLKEIQDKHLAVMRYVHWNTKERANGEQFINPNGSLDDIAGICDETGRIFGLMPHPEAFHSAVNHPNYTRIKDQLENVGMEMPTEGMGLKIFKNMVEYHK